MADNNPILFGAAKLSCVGNVLQIMYGYWHNWDSWGSQPIIPLHFDMNGNAGMYTNKYGLILYPCITASLIVTYYQRYNTKTNNDDSTKTKEYIEWERNNFIQTTLLTSILMCYLTQKSMNIANKKDKPTIGSRVVGVILAVTGGFMVFGMYSKPKKYIDYDE